jgi:hypothetical protein
LESTPWSYESQSWVRVDKNFKQAKWKHGKWKTKWKKHHRDDDDEHGNEHEWGNVGVHGHDD